MSLPRGPIVPQIQAESMRWEPSRTWCRAKKHQANLQKTKTRLWGRELLKATRDRGVSVPPRGLSTAGCTGAVPMQWALTCQ
jgi:hypothetical protein